MWLWKELVNLPYAVISKRSCTHLRRTLWILCCTHTGSPEMEPTKLCWKQNRMCLSSLKILVKVIFLKLFSNNLFTTIIIVQVRHCEINYSLPAVQNHEQIITLCICLIFDRNSLALDSPLFYLLCRHWITCALLKLKLDITWDPDYFSYSSFWSS